MTLTLIGCGKLPNDTEQNISTKIVFSDDEVPYFEVNESEIKHLELSLKRPQLDRAKNKEKN